MTVSPTARWTGRQFVGATLAPVLHGEIRRAVDTVRQRGAAAAVGPLRPHESPQPQTAGFRSDGGGGGAAAAGGGRSTMNRFLAVAEKMAQNLAPVPNSAHLHQPQILDSAMSTAAAAETKQWLEAVATALSAAVQASAATLPHALCQLALSASNACESSAKEKEKERFEAVGSLLYWAVVGAPLQHLEEHRLGWTGCAGSALVLLVHLSTLHGTQSSVTSHVGALFAKDLENLVRLKLCRRPPAGASADASPSLSVMGELAKAAIAEAEIRRSVAADEPGPPDSGDALAVETVSSRRHSSLSRTVSLSASLCLCPFLFARHGASSYLQVALNARRRSQGAAPTDIHGPLVVHPNDLYRLHSLLLAYKTVQVAGAPSLPAEQCKADALRLETQLLEGLGSPPPTVPAGRYSCFVLQVGQTVPALVAASSDCNRRRSMTSTDWPLIAAATRANGGLRCVHRPCESSARDQSGRVRCDGGDGAAVGCRGAEEQTACSVAAAEL